MRDLLEDKKGSQITVLDVRELSQVTDFFVLASGTSSPHLKALTAELQVRLKQDDGVRCYRHTGTPESGWMVLDYLDVVVHLFLPTVREYYALEELWSDAPQLVREEDDS
jgi:ribosome-associated protein